MSSSRQFAFLSFLDLISCAFGAAVLIFVISAISGNAQKGVESSDVLLLTAQHVSGSSPEIQFEIGDPSGVTLRTTDLLPPGYHHFAAPANQRAGAYLVIPKPAMGQWTVRTFWVDGTVKEAAKFSIKVYSPSLKPVERYVENVSLSSKNRYSQEISFKLQK